MVKKLGTLEATVLFSGILQMDDSWKRERRYKKIVVINESIREFKKKDVIMLELSMLCLVCLFLVRS